MQKRRLGQCDIHVSLLGLGTVKFGRNQGVKYPAAFSLPSDQEIADLLSIAAELGINLLDTAPAYGSSEERLGNVLRGQRHKWVLSTKVGEEFLDGASHFDFSAAAITASVERSLKRLQTDYLDVVLVHSNGEDVHLIQDLQVFETLKRLKEAGKIRAYGMSSKTAAGGMMTLDQADLAMVTYNPAATEELAVINYAEQMQKGIFIKKALASGHLQMPIEANMRFVLTPPGVTSVIVGTINPAHLREMAEIISAI